MIHKPNLIPNNPKDGSFDRDAAILRNGGYLNYIATFKKDGCRLELTDGKVKTRSLKTPGSLLVIERFQELADACKDLNIDIEGEFYWHGEKFNHIYRFFSKSDVTAPEYKRQLEKEKAKNLEKFKEEYEGKSIGFLTTFSDNLKFWLFDAIILDRPDIVGFEDRMEEVIKRLYNSGVDLTYVKMPEFYSIYDKVELDDLFSLALEEGFEGLVLTHIDHVYKFGRNTLNEGTLLKMKDDALEYDGIILDVMEGTVVKDGVETTTNELGRSVTSKKKEDREPSGMAKGFLVNFEGNLFTVGLRDFNNEAKVELLENKEDYIGRHFKYTGMKPVKDVPRHAYFDCWRDAK